MLFRSIYSPGTDQLALATGGSGRLFINSSGQVGVGTSPGATLDVAAAAATSKLTSTTGTNTVYHSFANTGGSLYLGLNNSAGTDFPGASAYSGVFWHGGAYPLVFATSNTERLRITSGGLVGIGESSPVCRLAVKGDGGTSPEAVVRIRDTNSTARTTRLQFQDYLGTLADGIIDFKIPTAGTASSAILQLGVNSAAITLDSSGRCGIGTTSPSTNLEVFGAANVTDNTVTLRQAPAGTIGYFGTSTNHPLGFRVNNTEYARIDSSGRLLVGTSSALSTNTGALLQLLGTGGSEFIGSSNNNNPAAGDPITMIRGLSQSGSTYGTCATIAIQSDAGTSLNDYPGRIVFSTTADGASSPTERMKIRQSGKVEITNSSNIDIHLDESTATSGFTSSIYVGSFSNYSPNNTSARFIYLGDSAGLRAEIRSNGGLASYSANNVNLSDRNVKKDIAPAAGTWDCLKQWEIVNFRYKDQPDDADLNMGVIAQQVAESCPEVIQVFQEAKEATDDQPAQEERIGVKEQQMMWMAIKALQEAQVRIETLEAEVAALKGA